MADGKVNLTFSTIAQLGGLNTLSDGIKTTGRQLKDFGDAGGKVVGALSAQFAGPLKSAMQGAFDILRDAARGGLWGIMGAVAVKGISVMADKFEEAKRKAKELADIIRAEAVTALAGLDKNAKSLVASMASATSGLEKSLGAKNRETDAQARYDVARIQTKAAKGQISDAEAAYEAAMVNLAADYEKAHREWNAWREKWSKGDKDVELAQRNLSAALAEEAKFREDNARVLERRAQLKQNAEADYTNVFLDPNQRRRLVAGYQAVLKKFEDENKEVLDNQKKVEDYVASARAALAAASDAVAADLRQMHEAGERERLAEERIKAAEARERTRRAKEAADEAHAAGQAIARLEEEFARREREEAAAAHKKKIEAMGDSVDKMKAEVSALDLAIAAQKKLAAEWERQAAGLRGKDFADLERERRDDAGGKAARAFERRNRANQRRAERLAAQEEFGRRHRTGGLSRRDADWLRRWREWQAAQDPKNNPAARQAAQLERNRDALQKKMQGTLEQIRNELRTANTIN